MKTEVKDLEQTITIPHDLPSEVCRELASEMAQNIRARLKDNDVAATVSVRYRVNAFKLTIKFKTSEDQRKCENITA